jgi:hypothetical protein
LAPGQSPWHHLYDNGDDQSYLNLTGINREEFEELHAYLYHDDVEHHGPDYSTYP